MGTRSVVLAEYAQFCPSIESILPEVRSCCSYPSNPATGALRVNAQLHGRRTPDRVFTGSLCRVGSDTPTTLLSFANRAWINIEPGRNVHRFGGRYEPKQRSTLSRAARYWRAGMQSRARVGMKLCGLSNSRANHRCTQAGCAGCWMFLASIEEYRLH